MARRYVLKWRRNIKPTRGAPAGGRAKIRLVAIAEIVSQTDTPEWYPMIR